MQARDRITRKGLRRQKHSEPKLPNPAEMSLADILAEANEILARQRHIDEAHLDHPRYDPELIASAYEWLDDCFPDVPEDLSQQEIVNAITRYYDGGWSAFVSNS